MADVLSQNEIDELLSAISTGVVNAENIKQEQKQKIKLYDFKRPDKFSKDQIRTLYMLHENFALIPPDLWHDMHIMSPIYVGTFIAAVATVVFLATRRFAIARFCAAAQVAFILWGWALAQYPYIIRPSQTIFNSASYIATLELVLMALAAGGLLRFPFLLFVSRL